MLFQNLKFLFLYKPVWTTKLPKLFYIFFYQLFIAVAAEHTADYISIPTAGSVQLTFYLFFFIFQIQFQQHSRAPGVKWQS